MANTAHLTSLGFAAPALEGSRRPILMNNSVSAHDGKNLAPVGREDRVELGAYQR